MLESMTCRGEQSAEADAAAQTWSGVEVHWSRPGNPTPLARADVPSIHLAWGGKQWLGVDGRELRLDDDVFLVLNAGRTISASRRDSSTGLLSVYFAPELVTRALEAMNAGQRETLASFRTHACFFEHLRDFDKPIASVLRYIAHHRDAGLNDPCWYEEQVAFLLRRLLESEAAIALSLSSMTRTSASKRPATFARLARVTDLIHSAYERPLAIDELAAAVRWSVSQLVRQFKAVHGIEPIEYLQRRRAQAAARLLRTTDLSAAQVAERVGFHERDALLQRLRRVHALTDMTAHALERRSHSIPLLSPAGAWPSLA
jgi:AraC-like DNA-binding protein